MGLGWKGEKVWSGRLSQDRRGVCMPYEGVYIFFLTPLGTFFLKQETNIVLFTVVFPVSEGDTFYDPQWIPETSDSTEPCVCICTVFFPTHTYL